MNIAQGLAHAKKVYGNREAVTCARLSILVTNIIPDLHLLATSDAFQCFPYYTYAEDGSKSRVQKPSQHLHPFIRSDYDIHKQ